ncbi:hypothetical protein [Methylobacter sp. sgz302048]|uniref:hypothetical protein n=1 Tax=Methylobacter sp. sgz302048 TaxID=3455945 RepID=UPI003FA03980
MNSITIVFLVINTVALLALPKRWAALPFLVGACYFPLGQGIELGPFNFPALRVLVIIGLVRVIIRGERIAGRLNSLDALMLLWAAWALISPVFHKDVMGVLVNRLGLVYNSCGIYFFLRVFCQSLDDVVKLVRITAILLIPLSAEMLYEHFRGHNLFSMLSEEIPEMSSVRNGRVRAQGPFAHSILAGTIGAVCLPLMAGLWQQHRKTSLAGIMTCCLIVFASSSSGPIMSAFFSIGALFMWHWRDKMRLLRWLSVLAYIALDLVMKAPAYYLIARIDLAGGSTSWHRAVVIEAAINHFSEWWFAGTDVTRHWLAYGVEWSKDHIDITNHYILMGVYGGLPLMLLFMAILGKGFSFVGQGLQQANHLPQDSSPFMVWAFGASLFAHAATLTSVSYFDQTFVFFYITLAIISSRATRMTESPVSQKSARIPSRAPIRRSFSYNKPVSMRKS